MNHLETVNLPKNWEELAGAPSTRMEVMKRLQEHPEVYHSFLNLSEAFQEELIAFSMGVQGVKITYDPFFKYIFDPYTRKSVLEDFLSQCLGEKTEIIKVLPNESKRLTHDSSLLIADLLVQLNSGALVNVEIQRIGYYFPGARCACYSSDLVMRQYSMVREKSREENKHFSYGDIQKVYTIVLMQKSTGEFKKFPNEYLHFSKQTFKSGLNIDLLQEYLLVPLDIFLKVPHNELSKLDAWLYFIASDKIEDIQRVCIAYPEFRELYSEVFKFRYHPKELVSMFSEALQILDQNTVQYMIDDLKKQLEEALKREKDNQKSLLESQKKLQESQMSLQKSQKNLQESQMRLLDKDLIISQLQERLVLTETK